MGRTRTHEDVRFQYPDTDKGLTLTVQTDANTARETLGTGLTLRALAEAECAHRGWPQEATRTIERFTTQEMMRNRERGRTR